MTANPTADNKADFDAKAEVAHFEYPTDEPGPHYLIDENVVKAENEDKLTPYLVFLISIVSRRRCRGLMTR